MHLLWVQQLAVLPVIVEDRDMVEENVQGGGLPLESQTVESSARRLGERERPTQARRLPTLLLLLLLLLLRLRLRLLLFLLRSFFFNTTLLPFPSSTLPSSSDRIADNVSSGNVSYDFQTQMAPPQQQPPGGQIFHLPGQHTAAYAMGRGQSPGAFSMSGVAGALPDYQTTTSSQMSHQDPQRFLAGTAGSPANYQPQGIQNQAPLSSGSYPMHPSQYPYQSAYGQMRASQQSSHPSGPSPVHSSYPGGPYNPASQQPMVVYPGQYGQSPQPQHGSYPTAYGPGPSHAYGQQGGDMSGMASRTIHSGYPPGTVIPYSSYGSPVAYLKPGNLPGKRSFHASHSQG